ncbi:unnamed protein product [Rotaria sp. Silwood1]|nr:unnamed protein product [Rotaria sp. Silwood1]CAF3437048.1 unnamed protein product [Rotaria sp. Silwood1]CAF3487336.1 unnamed protein product [Rotaria sp. Silwood1]CAF4579407.1 unnamed protein product [Rotaria sp. Silwood1]
MYTYDFGGPILQWIENHWEQVDIASFNRGGCELSPSEAYIRLAYYRDWIESYIGNRSQPDMTMLTTINITLRPTAATYLTTYECDKQIWPCGCGYRNVKLTQSNILYTSKSSRSITVSADITNRSDSEQVLRTVDRIYIHPNYIGASTGYLHDIAGITYQ